MILTTINTTPTGDDACCDEPCTCGTGGTCC